MGPPLKAAENPPKGRGRRDGGELFNGAAAKSSGKFLDGALEPEFDLLQWGRR